MIAGVVCFVCFAVLAIVSLFDSTEILGINRWIKPMKFFVSIAIFVPTVAALGLVAWFGKETKGRDLRDLDPDAHTFAATGY